MFPRNLSFRKIDSIECRIERFVNLDSLQRAKVNHARLTLRTHSHPCIAKGPLSWAAWLARQDHHCCPSNKINITALATSKNPVMITVITLATKTLSSHRPVCALTSDSCDAGNTVDRGADTQTSLLLLDNVAGCSPDCCWVLALGLLAALWQCL